MIQPNPHRHAGDPPPPSPANGDTAGATHPVAKTPVVPAETPVVPAGEADAEAATLRTVGQVVYQLVVGAIILGLAVGISWYLIDAKTRPAEVPTVRPPPVVEVSSAVSAEGPAAVRGYGTVRAARTLSLVPQVGGRVVSVHEALVRGGTVRGGEVVLEIEREDFQVAATSAEADVARTQAALRRLTSRENQLEAEVARAQAALATAEAEASASAAEWRGLNPGRDVPTLVAREPQLREARAAVSAAEAALTDVDAEREELRAAVRQAQSAVRRAELDLARTQIVLPGEGTVWRVVAASADVGTTVGAGSPVAELFDGRSLEVAVALEDRDLAWVQIPGSPVTVRAGGREVPGVVDRDAAEISALTRLAEVVVRLEAGETALSPGLFVEVEVQGRAAGEGVTVVERAALRRPTQRAAGRLDVFVWTERDGALAASPVEVVRESGDRAWVRGLSAGDRVVTTRLDAPTPGMSVRVRGED